MLAKLFYYYQQAMFYIGTFINEINKPLVPAHFAIPILTYLAINYDIKINFVQTIWLIVFSGIICLVGGMFLVKKANSVKINNTFSNQQNHEIMEILSIVKRVENLLQK